MSDTLPIALTLGDPSGIGPEITLKTWLAYKDNSLPPFFVIGSKNIFKRYINLLKLDVSLKEIETPEDAHNIFPDCLPILPIHSS